MDKKFYRKIYDMVNNSDKEVTVYDVFMNMDVEEFAQYGEEFFDNIRLTKDKALDRLKMPLPKYGIEALERIMLNQCGVVSNNDNTH